MYFLFFFVFIITGVTTHPSIATWQYYHLKPRL